MPRNAEGLLDDIGGIPPEPTVEQAPAPDPPIKSGDAAEPVQAETAPEATTAPPAEKPNPAASPDRPEGYVPQQALAEARREAKEARDRAAVLEDRTNKLLERFYKEAEPPEPEIDFGPDPDTDPVGAVKWMQLQRIAEIKKQHEQEQHRQQETAAERQFRDAFNTVQGKFQAATQARPEVQDAYNSLIKSYAEELQVAGWSGPQLAQQMQEIESNHIRYMAQNQIEPAEYIERLAKARGWQGRPSNAPPDPAQPRDPTTGQFVSEAAKAAKIATSQERNGSLSSVPGAPVEKMTSKEFAALPEEEIWRRLASAGKNRKQMERDLGFR
jgi:ribosome-binding protein aMBF1 (putative translation factor)